MDCNNPKNDKTKKDQTGSNPRIVTMESIRNSNQDSERQAYFAGGSEHSGQQILGRGKRKNEQDRRNDALSTAYARVMESIATMESLRNSNPDPDRQAYFAGGSEHSGQQILGGGKRRNRQRMRDRETSEALANAFRRASAVNQDSEERSVTIVPGLRSFSGAGYRLGDTESSGSGGENASEPDYPSQIVLTLWENGFSIEDGPLYSYDDPRCVFLMDSINTGELSREIFPISGPRASSVHLTVDDKRGQEFVQTVRVFGGKGHKLGSPTPPVSNPESTVNTSESNSFSELREDDLFAPSREDTIVLDDSSEDEDDEMNYAIVSSAPLGFLEGCPEIGSCRQAPTSSTPAVALTVENETDYSSGSDRVVTLKIRLPNGNVITFKVGANILISDLRNYIIQSIPSLSDVTFSLNLTYPRRELQDNESVDSKDINNAVLVLSLTNNVQ